MKKLIIFASLTGLGAIKLIPVQRPSRQQLNKNTDESSYSATSVAANKVVLDQLQSVKRVLAFAEVVRGELNELVAEFVSAESQRRRVGIFNRAQTLISSFLEKYDKGDLFKEISGDCDGKTDCFSKSSPYALELRDQIRLQFEREGSYYLELMDGIIQYGWLFVTDSKAPSPSSTTKGAEPTLATSSASFKSRDDVKGIFLNWKETNDNFKKNEPPKREQNSKFGSFVWFSLIGLIVSAGAAYFYTLQLNRNTSQSSVSKALYRKRQLHRRQMFLNAVRICTQYSQCLTKLSLDLISFVIFLLGIATTSTIDFFKSVPIFSKIFSCSTSSHKSNLHRNLIKKKKLGTSSRPKQLSGHQQSDEHYEKPMRANDPTESTSSHLTSSVAEVVAVTNDGVSQEVLFTSTNEISRASEELNSIFMTIANAPRDKGSNKQDDAKDSDDGDRSESPNSVVRRSSIHSSDGLGQELPPPVSSRQSVGYPTSIQFVSTNVEGGFSSDEEGWIVFDGAPHTRNTNRRKAVNRESPPRRRARDSNEAQKRQAPVKLNPNNKARIAYGVKRGVPEGKLATKNTSADSRSVNVMKEIAGSSHMSPSSGDSTDHESLEEYSTNPPDHRLSSNGIDQMGSYTRGESQDSYHADGEELYHNAANMNSMNMSPGLQINIPGGANMSNMYMVSHPSSPTHISGQMQIPPYYMMQSIPAGPMWPQHSEQAYGAAGPVGMPYCYAPPSPYGIPYGPMEGYGMIDPSSGLPLSPSGMPVQIPYCLAPNSDEHLVDAIRYQMEYYFSVENLCRDLYLRGKMDHQGFVPLSEIIQFNRIKSLHAPLTMILTAVQTSSVLEVQQPWTAKVSSGQMSDRAILETKIRCAEHWERWIMTTSSSGNQ